LCATTPAANSSNSRVRDGGNSNSRVDPKTNKAVEVVNFHRFFLYFHGPENRLQQAKSGAPLQNALYRPIFSRRT